MKKIPISLLSVFLILFAFADQAQAYYAPSTGRFINRDPIGERGGINVHAFVRNDSVNHWDYLGMCTITIDVGHGGSPNSRKTKRAERRMKERFNKPCDRFIDVGCGANTINNRYIWNGIGIPIMPPWLYPTNRHPYRDDHGNIIDPPEGFEQNDICMASELADHMDQAIETAKQYAKKEMCGPFKLPCCCKKVTISIECQDGIGEPGEMKELEEYVQELTGRKPVCGTRIEIDCEQ